MIDRTIVPLDHRPMDCMCGHPTDLARMAGLLHGWPLVFTTVAAIALYVLIVLLSGSVLDSVEISPQPTPRPYRM